MVYIVVLNWNGWKDTIECLDSLMKLKFESYKIVVCDNFSSDNSVNNIIKWYDENKKKYSYLVDAEFQFLDFNESLKSKSSSNKGIYIIQTGSNLGYAGGNNVGIKFAQKQSDMDYVWVINNDTEIEENALSALVECVTVDENIGVCGSKLVYYHDRNKIQGVGGNFNFWTGTSKHYKKSMPHIYKANITSIDYPIGASLLISRKCLDLVGLLSEDYFLYYEEVDYAMRTIKAGLSLCVSDNSIVYHKEGASIRKSIFSDYFYIKNKLLVTWKYNRISLPVLYFFVPLWFLNRLRRKEFKKSINVIRSAFSFLSLPK